MPLPLQKTGVLGFPPGPQMSRADSIFNGVREHLKKMLGNSWNCTAITNGRNIEIFCPFLLQRIIQIISELKKEEFSNQTKSRNYNIFFIRIWEQYIKKKKTTLTCVLGNAEVRSVSCVSSTGFLLGTLRTKAAWSQVAAVAVIRKPLSHRRWIPSLG